MDDRVDVVAARPLLVNGMGRTVDPPPMRRFDIIMVKAPCCVSHPLTPACFGLKYVPVYGSTCEKVILVLGTIMTS
jgi:hypothetical protein